MLVFSQPLFSYITQLCSSFRPWTDGRSYFFGIFWQSAETSLTGSRLGPLTAKQPRIVALLAPVWLPNFQLTCVIVVEYSNVSDDKCDTKIKEIQTGANSYNKLFDRFGCNFNWLPVFNWNKEEIRKSGSMPDSVLCSSNRLSAEE